MASKKVSRRKSSEEPDYSHRKGRTIVIAPPKPLLHECPDCTEEEKATPAYKRRVYRLTYLRSLHEQWGDVVTRHDVYRCRVCRTKWVSTNGREPEVTIDDI